MKSLFLKLAGAFFTEAMLRRLVDAVFTRLRVYVKTTPTTVDDEMVEEVYKVLLDSGILGKLAPEAHTYLG